ncbi:hypothetical protein [Luteimonas huabeiensis]|uniref:hypothetical protein n=1 Tax=Luteimonas huabeiensis TaxID=1244513 RepID=UPI0004644655|nr:hypothetical protein [Luteimonas huabeiensis]
MGFTMAAFAILAGGSAHAQDSGRYPFEEYDQRVNAARNITALDSGAFGERVSGFDGATSFEMDDIVLEGNNRLPVALGRKIAIQSRAQLRFSFEDHFLGGFGDWDINIPHVETLVAAQQGWAVGPPSDAARFNRCSRVSPPFVHENSLYFHWHDFWDGYTLSLPGVGGGQLMERVAGAHGDPSDGRSYPWVVNGNIRVRCVGATKNGYPGEAFAAVTPDGLTYYLDWAIERAQFILKKYDPTNRRNIGLGRKRVYLAATRIEDRFGNWVSYTYNGDKLQSITSSDGRSIALGWNGETIVSATASGGRTWRYAYVKDTIGATNLASVVNPDGGAWRYSFSNFMSDPLVLRPDPEVHYNPCDTSSDLGREFDSVDYRVEHPSGAVGTFSFDHESVWRTSNYDNLCPGLLGPTWYELWSLKSKRVEGVGVPPQTHTYAIDFSVGANGAKWNATTRPDGTTLRSQYGTTISTVAIGGQNVLSGNETLLLAEEILDANGAVRETREYTYAHNPTVGLGFPSRLGARLTRVPLADEVIRPRIQSRIVRSGEEFVSTVQQFDAYARPRVVAKSGRFIPVP